MRDADGVDPISPNGTIVSIDEHDRRVWIGLLSRAEPRHLAELYNAAKLDAPFVWLRAPEIGLVMARGRAGGDGAPFNLGELSATRCALRLESGPTGHACVLGRDKEHARRAALVDALMQTHRAEDLRRRILAPLEAAERARREARSGKAAATRVEFFTMSREA